MLKNNSGILFLLITIFLSFLNTEVLAQNSYELKGKVFDNDNNAPLELANIIVDQKSSGTSTDSKGRFKLNLPEGEYTLTISYVGYAVKSYSFVLKADTSIRFNMNIIDNNLREVEVIDSKNKGEEIVNSTQSSAIKMTQKDIEMVPTIAGENDIIKVVQLLPGVSKGIEGTGDFFVRGGDADQNLLLLDGATIYNTGHLFGFVSVFNPDIIGEATILKGAFPAYYGGRLSSILDIRTQSTISDKVEGEGSVGLISSKLMLKAPIVKNKVGIMLSARRTYIDQIVEAANADFRLPYYFYDFNGRIDYLFKERHNLYYSGYYGADILKFEQEAEERDDGSVFRSSNNIYNHTQTLGYQFWSKKQFKMNVEAHQSVFKYDILNSFLVEKIEANSGIEDYGLSVNMQKSFSEKSKIYFGVSGISHGVRPIEFSTTGIIASILPGSRSEAKEIKEGAAFVEIGTDITDRMRLRFGYRQSFGITENTIYPGSEPRIAVRYLLNERSSLKLSYSKMYQYLHRVSSSSLTLPVDLWYVVTDNIKPQNSDQYTIGYAWRHNKKDVVVESDIYYKRMNNLTEYEPGTTLLFNADFESALLQGRGESYGWEILVRKESGKVHGWISYSLGWSYRQFSELNEGNPYNSTYDRRHNGAIVMQYDFYKRWAFSAVWEFISGSRFTPLTGQYAVINPVNTGLDVVNIYADRNSFTLSDSHRLDIMFILKSKQKRRVQGEWRAGVYNVYNRATPVQMYVSEDGNGNYQYVQPGLFGALPFVSYHFKF